MIQSFQLLPEIAFDATALDHYFRQNTELGRSFEHYQILKRSIDARGRNVKVLLDVSFYNGSAPDRTFAAYKYQYVAEKPRVIIVGAGPAGYFAALRLIELGYCPVILERGKDARKRRLDLAQHAKAHIVNPHSNYCFGEGGAGTYSDGKLYTRSKKRGEIARILEILVNHGAHQEILVDAHPHIGTNKLPAVIEAIRHTIEQYGGQIHFDAFVNDFLIDQNRVIGVQTADGQTHMGISTILATGHSARDIYELCHKKQIEIAFKPFAMGVRAEHPQSLIDRVQYSRPERGLLPPASYSLVTQTHYKNVQRGVFSFCMCPGGFIVPAATSQNEVVVNGMSPSRRDSFYANSGIVVAINEPDIVPYLDFGPLAGLALQKEVENKAWQAAKKTVEIAIKGLKKSVSTVDHSQFAPSQLLGDFIKKQGSKKTNETSYTPGLTCVEIDDVLPTFMAASLRQGFKDFENKIKGFGSNLGQIVGVESRTSSPVRIPRERDTLEHVQIKGLYPCGEGAGYAGGIVSAAMDGERCAEQLVRKYG